MKNKLNRTNKNDFKAHTIKKIIFLMFGIMVFIFLINPVNAEQPLEFYTYGDDSSVGAYSTIWRIQPFTVGYNSSAGFKLTNISIKIYRDGAGGLANISIKKTNSSGYPIGSYLTSTTYDYTTLTTSSTGTWVNISLADDGINLDSGESYGLIISTDTSATDRLRWRTNSIGDYIFNQSYSLDSGSSWTSSSVVGMFEIYGDRFGGLKVILDNPSDNFITSQTSITFNSTAIPTIVNLTNSTLYLWNSTNILINKTTNSVTGNITNSTSWNILGLDFDSYKWNVLWCGLNNSGGTICNNNDVNLSFSIQKFSIDAEYYSNESFETDVERFELNLTTIPGILSVDAEIIYNGVSYNGNVNCDNSQCNIYKEIDIPLINISGDTQNKSFFWNISIFDGSSLLYGSSTIKYQNVSKIHLEKCNSTYVMETLNFTAYDEANLTRITDYDFDGTFEYWLGHGTVMKNKSISEDGISEETFCISPSDKDYKINSQIDYSLNSINNSYVPRNYYFQQATINNDTQKINLFLLKSEDSTTFILRVQDQTQQKIPGALINIQRYYPGEGIFRTVQVSKTDGSGDGIGFYKTETVDYKHFITLNNSVLLDTTRGKIVGNDVPFTLIFTTGSQSSNPWSVFEDNPNILTNLFFNDTTKIVTYSYIDNTGGITFGRLLVEQWSNSNRTKITVCDVNSEFSSATLTCNVTGFNGLIYAQGFITQSNSLTDLISFIVNASRDIFDKTGLILALFIILTTAMGFIWNPTVGIIGVNASIIFVNLIGLASFSPVFIFSIIGASIYVMILMKT